jgi:uncharacterized membrane protein
MGVKLFAWVGGFALFLGIVFLLKYAFENNLITPSLRILGGGVIGILLISAGWMTATRRYRAPAQSLCATGVLILYADVYAGHAFYNLISLGAAAVLMSAVTIAAFALAVSLDAQVVVVLGLLGGFVTPSLLWTGWDNPVAVFGYIAVLNLGVAAVTIRKRWDYLIFLAALGTVITAFAWASGTLDPRTAHTVRVVFLLFEALFLGASLVRQRFKPAEQWSLAATAVTGFSALIACIACATTADSRVGGADFVFPFLFLATAGLLALVIARAANDKPEATLDAIVAGALVLALAVEWTHFDQHFRVSDGATLLIWYTAVLALFTAYPYFFSGESRWPWVINAVAAPLQFCLVYAVVNRSFPNRAMGLLPIAFALLPAAGVWYLVRRRGVAPASGDGRLAAQAGAAVLFLSLVSPVQFEREWITLGWAIEGVALLYLFRLIPNQSLRIAAIAALCGAFVRLVFNPAVFDYHPRSGVRIWNWYLYAYGITAICLVRGAQLVPKHRPGGSDSRAPRFFYTLAVVLLFLLLNIEIADFFSIGPTLTFSFGGNFARDMTYTIAWALFAFALLVLGIVRNVRAIRLAAIGLLAFALAKLFLHDLDNLSQLYRIGAFLSVAVIAIVASFTYQRFLVPKEVVAPVDPPRPG